MSRTNWVANGGFETNTANWAVYQARSTIARDTTERMFGSASLKVVCTGTSDVWGAQYIVGSGQVPDATMTHSVYVKGEGTGIGRTLTLYLQTNAGTNTNQVVLTGSWQRISVTQSGIIPGFQCNLFFLVEITGSSVGDVFYLDGDQLEAGPVATDYIETDGAPRTVDADGLATQQHGGGMGKW